MRLELIPCLALALVMSSASAQPQPLRPPSVPLVAHDPYFSIWSPADRAADAETVHWTGARHALSVLLEVEGKPLRLLGAEPKQAPALPQTGLEVTPTRTEYRYEGEGIKASLAFLTPSLPHDLDLLARPITYIVVRVQSTDAGQKQVRLRISASAELCVNSPDQEVEGASEVAGGLRVLSAGTLDQPVLGQKGDWVRIDWGRALLAADDSMLEQSTAPKAGLAKGQGMALEFRPIKAGRSAREITALIGYDDEYSIQYFGQNLRPYWRRNGADAQDILALAWRDFGAIRERCRKFDQELMADLRRAGGEKYARLCALAYRQCLAANKLAADPSGLPLLFPKENTSNGCIATTDVIYPMAPLFLLFGPSLTRAMLAPVLEYSATDRWPFPFAPHDLGTYPHANGQVYGGGERSEENQMPVEESANMLILVAALAKMEGSADFASRYWKPLTQWAEYLKAKGYDPENQLCTDDFLGHLARNVNLSAKATMGIASYAMLCRMRGETVRAAEYEGLARAFAERWMKEAGEEGRTRLTFDRPGTWSQKYNIVWDRILGFGVYPDSLRKSEMAHYRAALNPFGLPLDSRGTGAKLDWSIWTATLTQNRRDFDALLEGVYRFVNESPQRVGMGDWYNTATGDHNFMHSRSVVGGVFIQLLYNRSIWSKWAGRDGVQSGGYAPIPPRPVIRPVAAAGDSAPQTWRFTTSTPNEGWEAPDFDDSAWKTGESGFGTPGTPGAVVKTLWDGRTIWIRRTFDLPADKLDSLALWIHHDDAADVFINGVPAARLRGWTTAYEVRDIMPGARRALRPGPNVVAVACRQDQGGQYIDLGFVAVEPRR